MTATVMLVGRRMANGKRQIDRNVRHFWPRSLWRMVSHITLLCRNQFYMYPSAPQSYTYINGRPCHFEVQELSIYVSSCPPVRSVSMAIRWSSHSYISIIRLFLSLTLVFYRDSNLVALQHTSYICICIFWRSLSTHVWNNCFYHFCFSFIGWHSWAPSLLLSAQYIWQRCRSAKSTAFLPVCIWHTPAHYPSCLRKLGWNDWGRCQIR